MDKFIPKNEHTVERVARVLIGVGALATVFVGPQTNLGWIGIIPLATGLIGSCPLYTLFGINTCKIGQKTDSKATTWEVFLKAVISVQ